MGQGKRSWRQEVGGRLSVPSRVMPPGTYLLQLGTPPKVTTVSQRSSASCGSSVRYSGPKKHFLFQPRHSCRRYSLRSIWSDDETVNDPHIILLLSKSNVQSQCERQNHLTREPERWISACNADGLPRHLNSWT